MGESKAMQREVRFLYLTWTSKMVIPADYDICVYKM